MEVMQNNMVVAILGEYIVFTYTHIFNIVFQIKQIEHNTHVMVAPYIRKMARECLHIGQ